MSCRDRRERAALTACPPLQDGNSRTVLITGANRGLGLEVSRRLLACGMNVVLACRDVQAGGEALAALDDRRARVARLDVAAAASVAAASARASGLCQCPENVKPC